jgi:hypothetical protein
MTFITVHLSPCFPDIDRVFEFETIQRDGGFLSGPLTYDDVA